MSKNADGTYDNDLSGALFKNEKRREGKKDPHYNGTVTVGGLEYWVNGWKKKSKSGMVYVSISLTLKKNQEKSGSPSSDEDIDNILF